MSDAMTSQQSVPPSRTSTVLQIHTLLYRAERRIDGPRGWGRDLDELFNTLEDLCVTNWPRPPQQSVELALRTMRIAFAAQSRIEHPLRTLLAVCDAMGIRLARSLTELGADANVLLDDLLNTWREANVLPPSMFGEILVEHLHPDVLAVMGDRLANNHMLGSSGGARILALRETASVAAATSRSRELALLVARTWLKRGRPDDARLVLEAETGGDSRVLTLLAEAYAALGRYPQAIEKLRRAVLGSGDATRERERMLEIAATSGDVDVAVDQVIALSENGSLLHWDVLQELLKRHQPTLLDRARTQLESRSLGLFVELLMEEGNVAAVIEASAAKSFHFSQLWRMGDWLAAVDLAVAASLYERAILMEGTLASSRVQCGEFGERVLRVLPFFEKIGKPTKPRRVAREVVLRNKQSLQLKKELERIFETSF